MSLRGAPQREQYGQDWIQEWPQPQPDRDSVYLADYPSPAASSSNHLASPLSELSATGPKLHAQRPSRASAMVGSDRHNKRYSPTPTDEEQARRNRSNRLRQTVNRRKEQADWQQAENLLVRMGYSNWRFQDLTPSTSRQYTKRAIWNGLVESTELLARLLPFVDIGPEARAALGDLTGTTLSQQEALRNLLLHGLTLNHRRLSPET
ncbi:CDC25-like phosphatase YCH1 [Sphaceloma murrayae]|uniref:CDC25-like phosphatase YCH1 n=1 Tax=Sphaceloma murrayae TaxID=2082308 RepID=A0A2K1QY96_9PEZI|nr:CDC25-like phosphatase YCH1 [Sphaceloma murrayae]